ncbi:MAG: HAD family hydrolase [Pseudomonadota bacterium]
MKKVVFFDRDGTLIIDKIYLNDPTAIEYLPGVFEGLRQLRDHGFEFIVVTNQSGVPRGLVDIENLNQIHKNIRRDFSKEGIDILQFYYAPFLVESNHPMRKPNPGMLDQGVRDFNVDRSQSWMVGDRMTDVEAGHRAQMKTVFLHGTEDPNQSSFSQPEIIASTFTELCQGILEKEF